MLQQEQSGKPQGDPQDQSQEHQWVDQWGDSLCALHAQCGRRFLREIRVYPKAWQIGA